MSTSGATGSTGSAARSSATGLAATAMGTVAWGFAGVLVKLNSISGLDLPFYRLWLGFLFVAAVVVVSRRRITVAVLRASVPGALFYAADVALFFTALKRTSVAEATFIGSLQPVLVLLVAHRLFGERLTRRQLVWALPALGGVAVVVLGGAGTVHGDMSGNAFAVGALLAWTGYWLASKHVRATLGTIEYMAGLFLISSLLLTPLALAIGPGLAVPGGVDWLWLVLLGLIPGAGHFLFNWAHRFVPATISSLVQAAVPIVATAAAYVILAEGLSWMQVLGGLVAVTAIAVICVSSTRGGRHVSDTVES